MSDLSNLKVAIFPRYTIYDEGECLIFLLCVKVKVLDDPPQSQYSSTTNSRMCGVLDIPPVSSAIIWARQVCRCGEGER